MKQHSRNARSYLAYPLYKEEDIVGVIYFFSTEPQVFPRAAPDLRLEATADAVLALLNAAGIELVGI